jgi:hypothetical protein
MVKFVNDHRKFAIGHFRAFTSASGWSTHAALSFDTAAPGRATVDGSAGVVQLDHAIPALVPGRVYAIHVGVRDWVVGRFQIYLRGGGSNEIVGINNYLAAHHVRVHQATHAHDVKRIASKLKQRASLFLKPWQLTWL